MTDQSTPGALGSNAGLGLSPERAIVAYLYHDAATPDNAHPWLHSTMLVLAADRRPTLRNETPLVTLAQAEAMVAAERERWIDCRTCRHHTTATGGCVSVLRCVNGSAYQRAGVRQCWDRA